MDSSMFSSSADPEGEGQWGLEPPPGKSQVAIGFNL